MLDTLGRSGPRLVEGTQACLALRILRGRGSCWRRRRSPGLCGMCRSSAALEGGKERICLSEHPLGHRPWVFR